MEDRDSGRELRERLYEAQCLKYQDGAHAALESFDRAILTLSAGALGLSLVFIKDVVPLPAAIGLWLLFWSWGLLGAAILLTLFSFIASHQAFEHQKNVAFEHYMKENDQLNTRTTWSLVTRYVTYVAGVFFLTALALTLAFAIQNMRHASAMIKTNQETSVRDRIEHPTNPNPEQKGVEPSSLIKVPQPSRLVLPNDAPPAGQPRPSNAAPKEKK
jgi:hypothetical protein